MNGIYEQGMSADKFKGTAFYAVKALGKLMLLYGDVEGIACEKHKYVGDNGEIIGAHKSAAFKSYGIKICVILGERNGDVGDEKVNYAAVVEIHKHYPKDCGNYEKRLPRYFVKERF